MNTPQAQENDISQKHSKKSSLWRPVILGYSLKISPDKLAQVYYKKHKLWREWEKRKRS